MRVYGDIRSGNCYKIKLLLAHLGRVQNSDYEWVHIDILAGESRTCEFLARNPNGRIPVLELDDGRCLSESNAILNYLADGSRYLPEEPYARAEVLKWQFFEQYSHEPYIATARFIAKYLGLPEHRRAEYEAKQAGGQAALAVLESHLAAHDFLVGDQFTIADITLYAYTHVADEGGFDLSEYPAVLRWLAGVSSQPAHITMNDPV
jgi:glutathione S-transferase